MTMNLRGIIIADIAVLDLKAASVFEAELKKIAKRIENMSPLDAIVHEELDDLAVIKVQAEVPLQERRGETGPISGIVFRGSRGANSPIRIPNNVSAGVKKRLQFARNTMIKKGMGTEDIQDQIDREAEHLMKQYNEGRKYIHYSRDMESIFDND